MILDEAARRHLFGSIAEAIIAAEGELTALDQAIGDGDHGLNMKRGFTEALAKLDEIAAEPLPDGLRDFGMTLVMKVGGASGPLYGTFFMALAKALPEHPSMAEFAKAGQAAVEAVMARGKSHPGQKTMLDVLSPVSALLAEGEIDPAAITAIAHSSAQATMPMQATRGRASFLGQRSVGHMDPGARSSQIMIETACTVLGETA